MFGSISGYLVLIFITISISNFAEKNNVSFLFSLSVEFLVYAFLVAQINPPVAFAAVLAGGVAFILILVLSTLDEQYAPQNFLFRFMVDLDDMVVGGIYRILMSFQPVMALVMSPPISIKNGFDHKKFTILLKNFQGKRWSAVSKIIDQADSDERAFLIDALQNEQMSPDKCRVWFKQQPENTSAAIIYGNSLISAAWKARGSGTADTVTEKSFNNFIDYLKRAQIVFEYAMKLDNDDPEPYVSMLTVAKGLGYDQNQVWDLLIQLIKRDKNHSYGHMAALEAFNPKWGGSSHQMFSFARSFLKPGHEDVLGYLLLPIAHIEQCLYLSMIGKESQAENYFFDDNVIQDINHCFNLYKQQMPEYLNFKDFQILNVLAYCFYQMNNLETTQNLIQLIGKNATEFPWHYSNESYLSFFDTGYTYSNVCKDVGLL